MSDLRAKRDLHNGFGLALQRAVELSATPAIFALGGWRLDEALGTSPLFLVSFFLIVISYCSWRMMQTYDAEMRTREDELLHRRSPATHAGACAPPLALPRSPHREQARR